MADVLGGWGRDFVEMIDERLNKPMRQWSPGTWVFFLIVVAGVGFTLSVITTYIIIPLWDFAIWLSTGKPLSLLRQIEGGTIFRTLTFFGLMVFIICGGFVAVRGVLWAFLSIWKDKRSLRQQIADDLAKEPRWRRLTFWPATIFVIVYVASMYAFMAYWVVHQFAHDMGMTAQIRTVMATCQMTLPARLNINPTRP